MEQWSQDNILLIAGASKKGGGINSILSLMQDLIAFQDKVSSAIEAQDIVDNKKKLEEYHEKLGEMYESLLEMARGGMRSGPKESDLDGEKANRQPQMMNDNLIQKLP